MLAWVSQTIVEGTLDGLDAARTRGRIGGRKPKLDAADIALARQLYDETGPDGKRRHTVDYIATRLRVSRKTIYRHLDPDGRRQPNPDTRKGP